MNKRWYDSSPTVSMAVSLLQNATRDHRDLAISHIRSKLTELHPEILVMAEEKNVSNLWAFIQKRRTMDETSWKVVETMRFLSEDDREKFAIEIIRFVYCLENDSEMTDLTLDTLDDLGAVL